MQKVSLLYISGIRVDGGTQPRAELNEDIIKDYQELWEQDTKFSPVTVVHDGLDHWLADGFHRVESARRAGKEKIEATVIPGTQRDAVLFSCKANARHGLRRSDGDKRRAILRLLDDAEWGQWSDGKIADHCVVSRGYVSQLRKKGAGSLTSYSNESNARQCRDGRVISTSMISATQAARAQAKPQKPTAATPAQVPDEPEETNKKTPYLPKKEISPRPSLPAAEEAPAPAPALTDQLGRVVPERLRPVFDLLTEPIKAMRQKIMDAEKIWTAVESQVLSTEDLKWMSGFSGFLDLHNLMDDLKSIAHRCKSALPFTVCSYCKGQEPSCRACRGTAVITEITFKSSPTELRTEGSPTLKQINERDGIETRDGVSFETERSGT